MCEKVVEIFKTNVTSENEANEILSLLQQKKPFYAINFDLEDCDKILRVEGDLISISEVTDIVKSLCFNCSVIE